MQNQLKDFSDKGFVQTDVKTDLGYISIDIGYSIRVSDGNVDLDVKTVQDSRAGGPDLQGLFEPERVDQLVLECLGVAN